MYYLILFTTVFVLGGIAACVFTGGTAPTP